MKKIYLDNNATTQVHHEVIEVMRTFWDDCYGNPSSAHSFGQTAAAAVERARLITAGAIGAATDEIIFTSGGTEANNMALAGIKHLKAAGRDHIVTTAVEHSSVYEMCRHLETEGFRLTILPVDRAGCIDPADLAAAVDYRTAIVSILLVNNETGTVQDVSEIAATAYNAGALFHVDAVQALGKMPLDVNSLGADMLSVSGHKINGPKGSGALFIRRGVKLKPLLYGGGQEKKQRPGTLNVPAVAGFGQACEIARRDMDDNVRHCVFLRDRFERGILECIDCAEVNGSHDARVCNTLNVSFHGHSGEVIASMLDLAGIAVSTGSACNAGRGESRVLKAMGLDSQAVFGAVRFSVGRYNSAEEIDLVVDKLAEVIGRLDGQARAVDIRKI